MSMNKPMRGNRSFNTPLKEVRKKFGLVGDEFTYQEFELNINTAKVFGSYTDDQVKGYIKKALSLHMIEVVASPKNPKQTKYRKIGSW